MTPFRRPRRSAVAVLTALVMLLAVPASAHDYLVESQPGPDAVADRAPAEVLLRFNNEVLDVNPAILVQDSGGTTVAEGTPTVDGATVTLPLPDDLSPGAYLVTWRVVSSDGHPIEGEFGFEVGGAAGAPDEEVTGPAEAGTQEDAATPGGSAVPEETAPAEDGSGTVIGPAEDDAVDEEQSGLAGLPVWARVVAGLAAAAAVATLVVLLVRRQRER